MTFMNLVRVQGIITEIAEREKIHLIQKKRETKIHEEEDSFKIKIPFFQLNSDTNSHFEVFTAYEFISSIVKEYTYNKL